MKIFLISIFSLFTVLSTSQGTYLENYGVRYAYSEAKFKYYLPCDISNGLAASPSAITAAVSHRSGAVREFFINGDRPDVLFDINVVRISDDGTTTIISQLFKDISLVSGQIFETTNIAGTGLISPLLIQKGDRLSFEIIQKGNLPTGEFGIANISYTIEWDFDPNQITPIPTSGYLSHLFLGVSLFGLGLYFGRKHLIG